MLEPAILGADEEATDVAVWISFWGMLVGDPAMQALNSKLHAEGLETYRRAFRAAWAEAKDWPQDVFEAALMSIVTCLFGLSSGGLVNPGSWTKPVLR